MYKWLKKNLKQNVKNLFISPYKIINENGKECYVIGVKKILKFSSDKVTLSLKNDEILDILGQGLVIGECSRDSIMLSGEIVKTEVKTSA